MNKSELNRITQELLRRSGSSVTVEMDTYFPGGRLIGGKYVMHSHRVTMYTEVIRQQCLQLFGSLESFNAYYAVVFAHELGHSMDLKLTELCDRMDGTIDEWDQKQIALQIEENAWNNAMPWIQDIDPAFIRVIVDRSLEAYRDELAPEIA
ncbi:hypothetical protein PVOR_00190 [Paenibacillus vortex V453]|uniref:IrrE N-terminal-like domain-containing protein n=2 Tax=Paenibacillus TaxID=44249 RepID=A0A163IEN4_9BACL|nr:MULTISPECIES: hypothetical protein [Paenibacillus]ANA79899.1 hypothetical protein A3958_07890 [Paenibacillus glucanolyticus]AVV56077.1 hypothetical protein C7121_07950 [Paenibacillus glucanolyticus]AWP30613.1 hypothetical protein B9D94_30160 [Paenibacillus sp. Cedars]EFU43606.1 hypothetical protein PVOR_00190 [Paenibacillus vortex V453]ETT38279.1 hypothetical protein C169_11732 [Paenibacillus sp. FSL R5-808]